MIKKDLIVFLEGLLGEDNIELDEGILKRSSADRFRKYEIYNEVYTQPIPLVIAFPQNAEHVSEILTYCNDNRINVIPRSGNSALEQMLESAKENHIILDMSDMDKIIKIDEYNMQVTAEAGVVLEDLENELRKIGLTTGNSPQSKPLAQMGGLVGVRSIGQFSTLYGAIEDMIVGMEAVFPNGNITRIKNVPRRAAGPDIRHVIMGSEGAIAVITEVTVKIFPYYPENNKFLGYLVDDMETGFKIMREIMVTGFKPSVARLYDYADAKDHFEHFFNEKCVLIFTAEGHELIAEATYKGMKDIIESFEVEEVKPQLIEDWFNNLNWDERNVELERKEIIETDNIGFTTEIAADWENITKIHKAVVERVSKEIPDITWVGGHASHAYINGTNLYFVYYYDVVDATPEEEITKYHNPINEIIVGEALKYGGTMVHHHGVGKARAPWIKEEYGSSFYILKELKKTFDPNNIMNAGNIIPIEFLDE